MKINVKNLFISFALTLGAGYISSIFTSNYIEGWYDLLKKPSFTPPNSFFAPIWMIIYVIMAISFYLVLESKPKDKSEPIILFSSQLVLNVLWSLIFFGIHNPLFSLIEILVLLIGIGLTIRSFYKFSETASFLLVAYFLWVAFAAILNFYIVLLN